jgi:hypothetical protein
MGILELIGLGKRTATRSHQHSTAPLKMSLAPLHNPFPDDRQRILRFDSELMSIADTGNHRAFNRCLQSFLTQLTLYNSNVSRYLVRGIRDCAQVKGSGFTEADAESIKELFREHNSAYIAIRGLIKNLVSESPLQASLGERADDLSVLDDDQNRIVYGSLLNIRLSLSAIEDIWQKIQPYENAFFNLDDGSQSR